PGARRGWPGVLGARRLAQATRGDRARDPGGRRVGAPPACGDRGRTGSGARHAQRTAPHLERAAHLPAMGRLRDADGRCAQASRLPDRVCEPAAARARGASRRRSVLVEAPAQQVHLQPPGTRAPYVAVAPFPADVGVSIVCHNNLDKLPGTLASLDAAGCPHTAIIVVDVLSTDGTVAWLHERYPAVQVEQLIRNDGPSPGRNVGIRRCRFPFVFLMDADVQVEPETIQRLRTAMGDDPAIKIGSPIVVHLNAPDRIQYADGSLHFICEAINPWMDRPLAERGPA